MWKKTEVLFLLMAASRAMTADVPVTLRRTVTDGQLDLVVMENAFLGLELDSRSGKVTRFYDRRSGREFAASSDLMQGLFKQQEWLAGNAELLTATYTLTVRKEGPTEAVVDAEYEASTGNFGGLRFRKTYSLRHDVAYLDVKLEVLSVKEENAFTLNIHNLLDLSGAPQGNAFFHARSDEGPVRFSVAEARRNGNNLVYTIAEPWSAFVNAETGEGIAMILGNAKELDNLYFWVGSDRFTMEWAYRRRKLAPMAEADRWVTEFRVMPFRGLQSVYGADPDLLLSVEQKGDSTLLGFYAATDLGKADVVLSRQNREITRKPVRFQPGQVSNAEFILPSREADDELRIMVEMTEKTVVFALPEAVLAAEPVFAKPTRTVHRDEVTEGVNGFYYYFKQFYVSPDMTFPFAFGLRGDFRDRKNFRLVVETPEGIVLNSTTPDSMTKSGIEFDGKPYVRHEFTQVRNSTYYSAVVLLATSTIEGPAEGLQMRYYASWDGGRQPAENLPITIVRIERAKMLERIDIGLELSGGLAGNPEMIVSFKQAGINYLGTGVQAWILGTMTHRGKGAYRSLLDPLEQAGIKVSTANMGLPYSQGTRVWTNQYGTYDIAGTLYYENGQFVPGGKLEAFDIEDTKAVNVSGNRIDQICPSYRGRWYEKVLDDVRAVIDYGYTRLLYDEETWGRGREICYCERCLSRFAQFLAQHYPDIPSVAPREATAAPDAHAPLMAAWWDFKYMLVQEIYQGIKDTAIAHGGSGIEIWAYVCASVDADGHSPGRLTSYPRLAGPLDAMLPMVYTSGDHDNKRIGDIASILWQHAKDNARTMVAISPARTYEYERIARGDFPAPVSVRYQILEGISQGATGFIVWAPSSALEGALSYKHIAEATRILHPVQDIIADGQQMKGLRSSNRRVHVRGMEHHGRAVILVAEYSMSPLTTRVEVDMAAILTVTDLETREAIARITPQDMGFTVALDEKRARLFLLE